jgi:polyisoprenoid-binding protein YceI
LDAGRHHHPHDGPITRVNEYFDPAALNPFRSRNPPGGDMSTVTELLKNPDSVGVWTLDPDRSTIRFNNKTMWGAMKVNGIFTEFSGDGQITDTGTLFGRVEIKAASLNTKLRKRDEDLRSPTFLDVEKYPDISVVVTGAEPGPGETLKLAADLTVKGTTAPMPMRANVTVLDDGAVCLTGQTTANRKKWGVTGNMLGMVGDKTTLSVNLVFRRTAG